MILLLLIVFASVVAFGVKFALVQATNGVERQVGSRFRAAEQIAGVGRVPADWVGRAERRVRRRHRLQALLGRGEELTGDVLTERIRADVLERLDDLERFFTLGPYTQSPEAKELLVERFSAARDRWQSEPWHLIEPEAETTDASR